MKSSLKRCLQREESEVARSILEQDWYKCSRDTAPYIVAVCEKWGEQDAGLMALALEALGWIAGGHVRGARTKSPTQCL